MKVTAGNIDVFRDLSSASIEVRHRGTSSLLQQLDRRDLAADYALKRLYRGLCSSAGCARQGFATALTFILRHTDLISNDAIVDALKQHLLLPQHASRQDRKDLLMGRCFALLVLCRSKRISTIESEQIADQIRPLISNTPQWASELVQQTLVEVVRHRSPSDPDDALVVLVAEYRRTAPLLDALSLGAHLPTTIVEPIDRDPITILEALRETLPHVHGYLRTWTQSLSVDDHVALFKTHIQPYCFAETESPSSVKHKLLGLVIIEAWLTDALEDSESGRRLCKELLSESSLNVIATSAAFEKHSLHAISVRILDLAGSLAERYSEIAHHLIHHLGIAFDVRSRSTTIARCLQALNADQVSILIEELMRSHCIADAVADDDRIRAIDLIFSLIRMKKSVPDSRPILEQVVAFLFQNSFSSSPIVSETCRSRLISALALLLPIDSDYIVFAMNHWRALHEKNGGDSIPVWSDALIKAWRLLDRTAKKPEPNSVPVFASFRLLISGLSLFSLNQVSFSDSLLNDAIACLDKYKASLKPASKKKQTGLDHDFGNVILDLVAAMLSQSCLFLRQVALSAFRSLSQFVPGDALQSIVMQLSGLEENLIEDDNSSSSDEDDEDDDDDNDNVEEEAEECDHDQEDDVDHHEEGNENVSSDENDKGSDSDSVEDDDDGDTVAIDNISDDDQYDAALVNYIKMRQQTKRSNLALKTEKTHFKIRLVDLLEQFVKANSGSELILDLVVPLLQALKTNETATNGRPLACKITNLLSKRVFNCIIAVSPERSLDLLKTCINEALHAGPGYKLLCFRQAVYFASRLYVRSCLDQGLDEKTIVDLFRPLIEVSFQKKNAAVNSQFLEFVFERNAAVAVMMLPVLVTQTIGAKNDYLRSQGFGLLYFIIRKHCKDENLPDLLKRQLERFQECLASAFSFQSKKNVYVKNVLNFAVSLLKFAKQLDCNIVSDDVKESLKSLPKRYPNQYERLRSSLEQLGVITTRSENDSAQSAAKRRKK